MREWLQTLNVKKKWFTQSRDFKADGEIFRFGEQKMDIGNYRHCWLNHQNAPRFGGFFNNSSQLNWPFMLYLGQVMSFTKSR